MKHAVIVAHPDARSLTRSIAEAYAKSVRALGQEVLVRDLYSMGFDPCLKASEIPSPAGFRFEADVVAERKLLADVDVFALVYPFWFNAPPAILKGYVDRVFSMGFGYEPGLGGTESLLDGKKLISFSLSGAPEHWAYHAPILFPVVGASRDGVVRVDGRPYPMPQHGFARTSRFGIVHSMTSCVR